MLIFANKNRQNMINVTKTYLPNKEKYKSYIDRIFTSNHLTNNGKLVQELTERLEDYLGVKNLLLIANGTLSLQLAYKLLGLKGEVITSPFSFVATSSSIAWENLEPVFADIDTQTLCIDPNKIEEKITAKTSAIVPVNVFGNTSDVESIQAIANKNKLKVIYDAAHSFGVRYNGESVLNYGDMASISFHSTKLFHSIEGGALVIKDDFLYKKAKTMINFGYETGEIKGLGINAKMNEFEAAMGLCVLDDIDEILVQREELYNLYKNHLQNFVSLPKWNSGSSNNYSYFPILLKNEKQLLRVEQALNRENIFPRRYFYPSLDTLDYVGSQFMTISRDVSSRILCLPFYVGLEQVEVNRIIQKVKDSL